MVMKNIQQKFERERVDDVDRVDGNTLYWITYFFPLSSLFHFLFACIVLNLGSSVAI